MLTVRQYADLHGYNLFTVGKWCRENKMPGAVKAPSNQTGTGYVYMIPKDAAPPPLRQTAGRPRMKFGKEEQPTASPWKPNPESKPSAPKRTKREINLFIRRHCGTMTYGQMSRALGIPTVQLRVMYDILHERYGI